MPNQCYTIVRWVNSIKVATCLFLIKWKVCQVILLAISFNLWPWWLSFTGLLGCSYSSAGMLKVYVGICIYCMYLHMCVCVCVNEWMLLFAEVLNCQTKYLVHVRTKHVSLDVDYLSVFHPRSLIESHYQKWSDFIATRHDDTTETIQGSRVRALLYM